MQDALLQMDRSIDHYAELYQVSPRTIRNYIKDINDYLRERGKSEICTDENGTIQFVASMDSLDSELKDIFEGEDYYTYKFLPDERQTIILMCLLNANDYITIAYLAELVYVSRNTVRSDLDDIRRWFAENDLKLTSKTRNGLRVEGTERNIRHSILKLLLLNINLNSNLDKETVFQNLLFQEFDKNGFFTEVEEILNEAERKFDVGLTEYSYHETAYYLIIVANRLMAGCSLDESVSSEASRSSLKYEISEWILEQLKDRIGIDISPAEVQELTSFLMGKSYISDNKNVGEMIDIQLVTNDFIARVFAQLDINCYLDFYLYDMLSSHIRAATWRIVHGHTIQNPLFGGLQEMYPQVFKAVEDNISTIEQYIGQPFPLQELSFIVMYIASIIEKHKFDETQVRVLIVCDLGRGPAQFIASKIQAWCPCVQIVDTVTPHKWRSQDYTGKVDMVISTMPLLDVEVPYLRIDGRDLENELPIISGRVMDIHDNKQLRIYMDNGEDDKTVSSGRSSYTSGQKDGTRLSFSKLLSESRIDMNADAADWREAIRQAGELLFHDGLIESDYINAMIANVEQNGPYIVVYPGIALPHAEPSDGAVTTGISVIRLRNPVYFGHDLHDPVSFVFALSIAADARELDISLYNFTKMMGMNDFVETLKRSSTADELINIIESYEKRI